MADMSALMDFMRGLLFDSNTREKWEDASSDEKSEMLEEAGVSDATADDYNEAVAEMCVGLPPEQVAMLMPVEQSNAGSTHVDQSDINVDQGGTPPPPAAAAGGDSHDAPPPPPPPAPAPAPDLAPVEQVTQTINYYVTNVENNTTTINETNIDDRDVNIDNSVEQNIIANGDGDVDVDFDNDTQVSGDGGVNIGEGAEVDDSAIVTGDGAVGGGGHSDVNAVTGEVDGTFVGGNQSVIQDSTIAQGGGDAFGEGSETTQTGGDVINAGNSQVSTGEGDAFTAEESDVNTGDGQIGNNVDVDIDNSIDDHSDNSMNIDLDRADGIGGGPRELVLEEAIYAEPPVKEAPELMVVRDTIQVAEVGELSDAGMDVGDDMVGLEG